MYIKTGDMNVKDRKNLSSSLFSFIYTYRAIASIQIQPLNIRLVLNEPIANWKLAGAPESTSS